jgi:hypothetical protein
MTVSSILEAKLRHRAPSMAPARATEEVLGIASFEDAIAQARFNGLSRWGYGTSWGVVRGLLGAAGLPPHRATAAYGAAVWGNAQVMLPALDIAPPSVLWLREEIAIDLSITPSRAVDRDRVRPAERRVTAGRHRILRADEERR